MLNEDSGDGYEGDDQKGEDSNEDSGDGYEGDDQKNEDSGDGYEEDDQEEDGDSNEDLAQDDLLNLRKLNNL